MSATPLLPGGVPSPFPPRTLSLCMIVKNEEKNLGACLQSVRDAVDEIIVVDTGSTDRTVEIARSFGAKVVQSEWRNDFSYSRNLSLDKASCAWILWLDADDRVEAPSLKHLRRIKEEVRVLDTVFGLKVKNVKPGALSETFMQVRLFPNDARVRFERRIHEQISLSLQRLGYRFQYLNDTEILHTGYADLEQKKRKGLRNREILDVEMKENPQNPNLMSAYGDTFFVRDEWEPGIEAYQRVMEIPHCQKLHAEIYAYMPVMIALGYKNLKQFPQVFEWVEKGLAISPERIDLLFLGGEAAFEAGERERAVGYYRRTAAAPDFLSTTPLDAEALRVKSKVMLGRLSLERKAFAEAEKFLREVVQSHPQFGDVPVYLAEALLHQKKVLEAARVLGELVTRFPSQDSKAYRYLGDISRGVGKLDEAVGLYEKGLSFFPSDRALLEGLKILYREKDEGEKYLSVSRRLAALDSAP